MPTRELERFLKETVVGAGALLRSTVESQSARQHDVDLLIDRFIGDAIARSHPDHRILSEEREPGGEGRGQPTWIVDPVDGSENLYRGILAYTISVSLTCDDDILLGAVFEPYSDRLFFAAKGEGATMNGRPIRVSGRSGLQDAVVALSRHTSFLRQGEAAGRAFHDLLDAVEVRITSSTALDMCCVANGSIEGRVMANTRVWDNSAATLLVREAGGMVTDWDGGAALPSSRKLVASNGLCHQAILALLRNGGEKR